RDIVIAKGLGVSMNNTAAMNELGALAACGLDFSGQKVLIVGTGGIGLEAAKLFALLGAELIVFDRALDTEAMRLIPQNNRHTWVQADITDANDRQKMVQAGNEAEAVLVTSAICPDESLLKDDDGWLESFDHTLGLNLAAPMLL